MVARLARTLVAPTTDPCGVFAPLPSRTGRIVGDRGEANVVAEWSAKPGDFLSAPYTNVLYGWTHQPWPRRSDTSSSGCTALEVRARWPVAADRPRSRGSRRRPHARRGWTRPRIQRVVLYPVLVPEWCFRSHRPEVPARAMVMVLLAVRGSWRVSDSHASPQPFSNPPSMFFSAIAALAIVLASAEYFSPPASQGRPRPRRLFLVHEH